MTGDVYSHVSPTLQASAVEEFDAAFQDRVELKAENRVSEEGGRQTVGKTGLEDDVSDRFP